MREFSTPMMQQYIGIRQQYPDCMLFFRLGDFYELFLDDALEGARILGITLTRRPRGKDGDIPMAGVPFHSADTYIAKLLRAGKKIAICEQVSEPDSKGIVDRKVIRIITPGTILDDRSLEQKQHNFVGSIEVTKKNIGVALADVLTGDFHVTQFERDESIAEKLGSHLLQFAPSECVVSLETYNSPELLHLITKHHNATISYLDDWKMKIKQSEKKLIEHFSVISVSSLGFAHLEQAVAAAACLVVYIDHTQQSTVTHLQKPKLFVPEDYLSLDPATVANLEIFSTIHDRKDDGSLLQSVDFTKTAAGGRLLRTWVLHPQKDIDILESRYDVVSLLYANTEFRTQLQNYLLSVLDVERLVSKLALHIGTIASLLNIAQSLQVFLDILPLVTKHQLKIFQQWHALPIKNIEKVVSEISKVVGEVETPSGEIVRVIKAHVSEELDSLRTILANGEQWIEQYEKDERGKTGITSLKCRYNSVFGYYIEVSQSYLKLVPENYQRKQTLVNAERFITPELKVHEEKILAAKEKIEELEREIFNKLVETVVAELDSIKVVTQHIAELDVLCGLAQVAQERRYCRPTLIKTGEIQIVEGKHPVLAERLGEQFVPNDVTLNDTAQQLLMITGPNMAGKSVFMRQVALLVILAQIGSFIPARSATLPIVDRIFVRSGAADNISRGLSTFMVEMVEAATILQQATSHSLVIMDEIGRGTSTYDGISIAWAIAEYFVTHPQHRPKVLFATHYHELQELAEKYPDSISNYQVLVENHADKPIFLYSVVPGAASHSFGIAVAKLAGIPTSVLERAQEILHSLENTGEQINDKKNDEFLSMPLKNNQTEVIAELLELNISSTTPLTALQILDTLQKKAQQQ